MGSGFSRLSRTFTLFTRQQLIQGDRQIADADTGGVIDGVGDGSGGADVAQFPDPLRSLVNALRA